MNRLLLLLFSLTIAPLCASDIDNHEQHSPLGGGPLKPLGKAVSPVQKSIAGSRSASPLTLNSSRSSSPMPPIAEDEGDEQPSAGAGSKLAIHITHAAFTSIQHVPTQGGAGTTPPAGAQAHSHDNKFREALDALKTLATMSKEHQEQALAGITTLNTQLAQLKPADSSEQLTEKKS